MPLGIEVDQEHAFAQLSDCHTDLRKNVDLAGRTEPKIGMVTGGMDARGHE
jgi:hypothetical protein